MGHESEEGAPLLVNAPAPAGYAAPPTPYPYPPPSQGMYPPPGYAPNYATGPPPPSSFPPAYQQQQQQQQPQPHMMVPNAAGNFEVPCRVCSNLIQFSAAKKMSAVKCPHCSHATQVGPPPTGKNFILCHCNTLLTVPISAKAATCPKVECKKTLILAPEDPGKNRAFCAHCSTLLTYRAASAVVICPKCRGRSVVSRAKLHGYIGGSVAIGILFIFLCLFFTLTSYEASGGTFYFVFWGIGIAGVLALVRAVVYTVLNWRARDASIVPV